MNYTIKEIPITERPRERLKKVGPNNLSDKELLAIILKTGTKNKNVSNLSLEILNNYSLSDLKNISIQNLTKIKGIGEVKAIELLATIELGKRIFHPIITDTIKLTTPKEIYMYIRNIFFDLRQEHFYALYFDNNKKLIDKKLLFLGTLNESIAHPREVFKEAYRLSAAYIVVVHNHPSNNTNPSKADTKLTENLINIGNIQGIPIVDHIIVGTNNYYSFYENKTTMIEEK